MRHRVDAGLATQAHADGVDAALALHEDAFQRAMEKLLRQWVRRISANLIRTSTLVSHYTTATTTSMATGYVGPPSPIMVLAANPDWHLPMPNRLLDQDAAQAEIDAASKRYRVLGATTSATSVGVAMGLSLDLRNSLLEGVIASQAGMRITTAPEDLVGTMMGSLQESYDAGLGIDKAARAMRSVGYAHSQGYSARIARTELIGAVNGASLFMVTNGTDIRYKVWMATADSRTRDSHAELDGATIPVGETFDNGCAFPGDPDGDAEEVINCRCTLGYSEDANVTAGGGAGMAATDTTVTTDEEAPVGASWAGVIAQEGVDTGDGRRIEAGALAWRELPLTLMAQHTTPDFGGHAEAQVAGRIDSIDRAGSDITGGGVFDTGEWGADTQRMVADGVLRGISIDLAIDEAEIIPNPDIEDPDEAYWMGTLNILSGTILGATIVPFPAFENASVAIIAGACMRVGNLRIEDGRKVCSFTMPFGKQAFDVAPPPPGGGGAPADDESSPSDQADDDAQALADLQDCVAGWPGVDGQVVVTINGTDTTIPFPPADDSTEEPGEQASTDHIVELARAVLRQHLRRTA